MLEVNLITGLLLRPVWPFKAWGLQPHCQAGLRHSAHYEGISSHSAWSMSI